MNRLINLSRTDPCEDDLLDSIIPISEEIIRNEKYFKEFIDKYPTKLG